MSDERIADAAATTAIHTSPQNKRPAVIYPTVSPETVVIPIVSSILGFPLIALLVICCLRKRARMAREQARKRDIEHGTVTIITYSSVHFLVGRSSRAVSLRSERAMSRGFASLELDTVLEERSDPEPEVTVVEVVTPDFDSDS